MNNTVLERIGIDPIIIFIIMLVLIAVLFYMVRRLNARYNQLKNVVRHMNKAMRAQGMQVKGSIRGADIVGDEATLSSRRAEEVLQEIRELRASFADTYQKTGIVKYDAFDEMGGKLSFVLVMLDGRDNGILLNVMHSRDDCYTYIKEIKRGASYVELSAEEQLALEKALHQDESYEENYEGIPTGHTGNLKRAYTLAMRRQAAKQKELERLAAEKEEADAKRAAAGRKKSAAKDKPAAKGEAAAQEAPAPEIETTENEE